MSLGAVFYRGPSALTGEPILGIATGLDGSSLNPKTGPMVQTWILLEHVAPNDGVRSGEDVAICGDCSLRGKGAHGRTCYVQVHFGPLNVWTAWAQGNYLEADLYTMQALLEGRAVRLGAYGDPAAIPFETWEAMLKTTSNYVGYTHQHRTCDPRFKTICMASVEDEAGAREAWAAGWRTFRVRLATDPLLGKPSSVQECVCPASEEAGKRTTCESCSLCRGTGRNARSVAIVVHGLPGNHSAFAKFHRRAPARIAS